jgi:hypothetical protein
MRSIKIMLLIAMAAMALAAPTMASASVWTEKGVPLGAGDGGKAPAWTNEGELLGEATSISLNGTYKFTGIGGDTGCTLSAGGTLSPGGSGQITSASISALSCTTGGPIASCKVDSTSTAGLPWGLTATEKSGVKSISATGVSITYKLVGSKGGACVLPEITVTGGFTATPDDSLAIKNLALSGTMKTKTGTNVTVSGSQSVTPSGKLGIAYEYWGREVALDGNLVYTNVNEVVNCPVDGTIVLVGGTNEGAITDLAWDAEGCSVGGAFSVQCGNVTSVKNSLMPWPVYDEGSAIRISEFPIRVNFSKCGSKTFKGELTATPNNKYAISSTSIWGILETGSGGKQSWGGSLSWTPAGVYGLE